MTTIPLKSKIELIPQITFILNMPYIMVRILIIGMLFNNKYNFSAQTNFQVIERHQPYRSRIWENDA
jgi:hypothetical protein